MAGSHTNNLSDIKNVNVKPFYLFFNLYFTFKQFTTEKVKKK